MLEKLNRCYVSHSASTVFKRKKKKKEKKKLKTVLMKRIFGGGVCVVFGERWNDK